MFDYIMEPSFNLLSKEESDKMRENGKPIKAELIKIILDENPDIVQYLEYRERVGDNLLSRLLNQIGIL